MHLETRDYISSLTLLLVIYTGNSLGALRRQRPIARQFHVGQFHVVATSTPVSTTVPKNLKATQVETNANKNTFRASDIHMGCREIRSKRYLSDGFCASTKGIEEIVCTGKCEPIKQLPWYPEIKKYWDRTKHYHEWRCVEDVKRKRRVKLSCADGTTRTYKIKVVKSCKCKRYTKKQKMDKTSKKHSKKQTSSP